VDGNDILATYAAAREAVEKARAGGGPTLIEAVTYRLGVHTTADDPTKYRSPDEVAPWEKRDPLVRFSRYLQDKGTLTAEMIAEIEADVGEQVKQGVEAYEAVGRADPLDALAHLYEELPAEVAAQREELAAALERERRGYGR
jgi:TPP-dependent pyruvate/acetoin dehydrogenase alpha subunit